ncbi:titin homolog isoform X8 [Syngnathus acus]|uniref:titin homolog isoform X8 n=1 Tax=Syngnathus acus TaxID=161584 RepID=UPI0018860245|nr:titin homolog isoform X8 [Syngnathus acus]
MGDAQSVFEEGEPGQDAAERQVEDDKKLLKNNCQIDAKSATLLVEVNGIQEDDTNAQDDWLPENPPKEVETKVVGNEMEPIKEGKKKGVSSEVTEVEAKHNDINESFKTFFSKVGLKFTLKRGSRDHGENQEGDSTEVQKPTEQIQDDTTQADTTCESKNEDSTWPTEGEATDSQNEVNIPDEEWTHLDTPSEQDPSSPSSPKEHVTMSPMKKFFALGLFTRLGKKRLSLEDETITRELVMEEVGDTEKEMAQDQNEDIENTTVALADVYKEENPPADMISEPGGPNEIEDVPSSALKRLLLGSSLVKIKRQKEAKTSVGEQCQPSSDDPDQLLSPAAMAENDKKQSPTQPAETTVVQEEESPWATFKKLLSPKKRVNRSALNNDDMQNPMPKDELKSSEGDDILECRMDEGKKRKDSAISWDAILCARSQTATDFDDETQTDDANGTEAVENYDNCDVLASTPKKAASPPESDVESLCQAFKRLMSPKRKAKLVEEMQRSPETESMQENVSLLGKIFPGWNKRKSVPNKDQEATSCEVDQVGDLNCIMPLYDYDIVETEPKETVAGREPSTKTDIDLKQDFLPEVMDAAPPSENLQTEEPLQIVEGLQNEAANEDLAHLTEFIEKALSDIPEEGELTESTTAENVIVITSEVRSAPHPVEVSLADNSAMISALSQQAEKTSDATIPVLTKAQVEETEELMQPGVESTTTLPEADLLCSDTIVGSVLCDTLGEDSHLPGSKQSNAPTTMIDLVPNEMEAATDETESSIADKIISTEALDTQEITPTEKLDMKKISTPIPTEEIDTEEITLHISTKELETVGITHAIPNEEPDIEKITPQILVEKLDIKEIKSPIRSKELDTQSTTTPSTKELHTKEITSPIPTQVVDTKERGPQNLTKELGTTEITSPIPTEELDIETTEITSPIPTEKLDTETIEITSPIPTEKVNTEEMAPQILTKLGTMEITRPIPTEVVDTEKTGPQVLPKDFHTTEVKTPIPTEKLDTETTVKVDTEDMEPQILTKELGTIDITNTILTQVVDTKERGPQILTKGPDTTEITSPISTEKVDTEDMGPQILTKELDTTESTSSIPTDVFDTGEMGPQVLTKESDTTEITSSIPTEEVDTEEMGPQVLTKELNTTEITSPIPTELVDTEEMEPQVLTKELNTTIGTIDITSPILTEKLDTETTEITSPIPTEKVDTEDMGPQSLTKVLGTTEITSPIPTKKLDTETIEITSPIPTEKVNTEEMEPQILTKDLNTTEITSPIRTEVVDTEKMGPQVLPKDFHTTEVKTPIPTEKLDTETTVKVDTEDMEPQILTKELGTIDITSPILTQVVDTKERGPQILTKGPDTTESTSSIPTEKVDTEDMGPQILTKELDTTESTSSIPTDVFDTGEMGPQVLTKEPDTTEITSSIPTEEVDTEEMGPQVLTKELNTTEITSPIPTELVDTEEMEPQVLTKELNTTIGTIDITSPILTEKLDTETTEITSPIPTEKVDTEDMGPQSLTKVLGTTEITSPIPTKKGDTEEMEPQILTKELGTMAITSPIPTEKLDTETTELTSPIPTEKVDAEDSGPQILPKELDKTDITRAIPTEKLDTETTEITRHIPTEVVDTEETEPQILTKELGTTEITSPIPTEVVDTEETGPQILTKELSTTVITSPIPTEKLDTEETGPQILTKELSTTVITSPIPTEKLDTETTEITSTIPTEEVDTQEMAPQILTKEHDTIDITSPIPTDKLDTEEIRRQILINELHTTEITSPIPTEKLDTPSLTEGLSTKESKPFIQTEVLYTKTETTPPIPTKELQTVEITPPILTEELDSKEIKTPIFIEELDIEEFTPTCTEEPGTEEIIHSIPNKELNIEEIKPVIPTEGLDMEEIIPPMTTWKIRTPIQTEELNTEEITPSVLAKELDTQENTPPIPKEEFNTTEITIPILAKELEPQETSPPIPTEELDTNEIKTQFPIEELDIEETKPARTEEPDTEDMKPSIATKKPDIEELKSPFHTEELDTQEITPPIPTEDLDIKEISTPNPDKGLDTKEIRLPTPTKAYEIEDITPALPTETLNTKEIKPNHSEDLHSKEITTPIPSQELGTEDIRAPPSTEEHGTDDITPPIPAKGFKIEEIQTPFLTEVLGTNKISTPTPQILIQEPPTKELTLPSPTQETNIEEIVPPIHTENSATEAITASIPTRKLDSSEITHPILSQEVDTQENSARIFYEQFDGEEIIPPIPTDEFDAVEIKHPITAQELDTEVILPPNSTQKFDYKETPPHISTKELETEEMATEKTKTAHFSNSENNFSKLDSMDEIHVFLEDCLCDISKGESSEQLMEHEAVATEDDIEAPRSEKTAHTDLKESDTKQNTLQMVIIHQKVKVTSEKCPEAFTEELQSTKEISSEPILNSGEVSGAQTETLALQECRLQLALDKVLCEKVASEVKETTKLLSEISTEPFNKDVAKEPVDTSQDELIRETEAVQATPQQSEKVEAELVENQKEESILLPEVEEKAMAAPEIEIIQEQVSVATQKKQLEPDLVEVQHAEVKEDIHGEDPLMEEVKDENVPLLEADIKPEENDQRRASDIQIELVKEDKDTVVLDLSVKAEGISESILAEEAMTDEVKYSPLPGSENELESKDQKAKAEFSSLKEVVQESCLKSYEHQEVGDPQKTMTEECEQEKASQLQTIIESAKDEVDVDANEIEPVEETLGQSKQSIQTESVEAEETIFAEEMMTAELKEETVCSTEVQPPSDQQAAAVVKTGLNPDQAVAQEGEAITDIAEDKTGEVKEEAISLSETNVEANQEADTRKEMELLEKPSQALSVNVTNEVPEEANQEADTQKEVVLLEKHAQVISLSETNVVPEEANQEAENEMENIHFFEALVSKEANMELLQSEETTEVILVEESLPSEHKDQVEPLPELPGNKDMKQISDLTEGTPAKKTEDTQNESMKSGAETEVLQSVSDEVQEPQEVTAVKTEIIEEVPMSGLGTNEESLTQTFSKETLVEEISETENDIASEAEETKPQRDQAFNKEEDSENTDLHRQQDVMDREEDGTPEVSEAPVSLHQKEQSCAQILEKVIYEEIPEVCGTLEDQVKLQAHQSDVENKTEGENHDLPEVTTAEVAHALVTQVTMCHFKKVSTSLPDLITTSSDMQEPLLEYVLPESTEMVVSELPTITKNNLAQRARVANEVVMMQATAMEVNHSIQVQVVQMDITTAEKSVDQILEVGIGDKGVTDVCNRNIEGLEEVMQENYAGMCHELVPHVMENKLETLDQMVLKEAKEVEMGEVEGNMELSDETQSLKVLVPICALEAEEPMAPTDKAGKAPVAKEEHLKDSQKDPEPVKGHRTLVLQDCVQQMEPAEKGKHKTEQVQSPESFPQTDLDEYQDIKSNEVEELQSEIDTEEHSSLPDLKRTEQSEVSVQTILALDSVLSVDNHKQLGITGENVQVQEIEKPSCPKAPSEIEETALADEHIQSPIESTETQKQMELVEKHVQTSENPEPLPPKESTETQEQKELLKIHDQGRENQVSSPQREPTETQNELLEKHAQASQNQEPIIQKVSTETQKEMEGSEEQEQVGGTQVASPQDEPTETQKQTELQEKHVQESKRHGLLPQKELIETQKEMVVSEEHVQANENQESLLPKMSETQKQMEPLENQVQAGENQELQGSTESQKQIELQGKYLHASETPESIPQTESTETQKHMELSEENQAPLPKEEPNETEKSMELQEKYLQASKNQEPLPQEEPTETQKQTELQEKYFQATETQDPLPQNDSPETQEQTKLQEKYFQASGTQEPISQRESTETQKQMNLQQKDVQASQIQELIAQEESTETQKHKEISEEHEQAIDNQVASPQEEPTESQTEQVQASENQKPLPQKEFMETQKQTEETEEFVQATETEMVSFPKEPATDQNQAVRIEETSEPASELKSTEITAKANSSVLSGLPTREIEDPVEEKLPMITVKLILEIQPVETMEPQEAVGATVDETPNMWKTQTFKCASKPETEDDGEEIWMDAKEEIEIQEAPKDESPRRDGNFEAERECEGGHFDIAVDNSKMESAPVAERDRAGRAEEQKVTTAEKDALN